MAPGILIDDVPNGTAEPRKMVVPVVNVRNEAKDAKGTNGFFKLPFGLKKSKAPTPSPQQSPRPSPRPSSVASSKAKTPDSASTKESEHESPKDEAMKCEIKHLDQRYDDKDEQYFAERKSDLEKPKQKDWWRLFAFCLVRHYDEEDDLDTTKLYINPQPLRQLLKDVIGNYPSQAGPAR
jgi:hypothetical protein